MCWRCCAMSQNSRAASSSSDWEKVNKSPVSNGLLYINLTSSVISYLFLLFLLWALTQCLHVNDFLTVGSNFYKCISLTWTLPYKSLQHVIFAMPIRSQQLVSSRKKNTFLAWKWCAQACDACCATFMLFGLFLFSLFLSLTLSSFFFFFSFTSIIDGHLIVYKEPHSTQRASLHLNLSSCSQIRAQWSKTQMPLLFSVLKHCMDVLSFPIDLVMLCYDEWIYMLFGKTYLIST